MTVHIAATFLHCNKHKYSNCW